VNTPLTTAELDALRHIPSPTIANAIERFKVRGNCDGWTHGPVRCLFPELGAAVGYAVTLTVRSAPPTAKPKYPSRKPYWDHIAAIPAPRIVVVQELDQPPAGAFWGEVNANIHRALGCVGVLTDGSVRDLDEVRRLGFQFWAAGVQVSHGYARIDDFNQPVTVFGLTVHPGDLIHADQHGALVIPAAVAREVAAAAKAVEDRERPMIQLCNSADFSTAKLAGLLENEVI
jgi:regulator of RNase E activity RraA